MSDFLAAPLSDPPASRRPAPIIISCALMAGFALFDVALAIFMASEMSGDGGFLSDGVMQYAVGMLGAKALITGALYLFIWRGHGWSRIAYAALTLLSVVMSLSTIGNATLPVLPVLQFFSLVLLFVPSANLWFAHAAAAGLDEVAQPFAAMQPDMIAPGSLASARSTALRIARSATLKCGIGLMFLVLGLGLWCACLIISTWMATWPADDAALAYMVSLIPAGGLMLGDVIVTVISAFLIWNGFGAWRFVYGSVTALGLRLLIGVLPMSPGSAIILYAACLTCFILLFAPPSNRWLKAQRP